MPEGKQRRPIWSLASLAATALSAALGILMNASAPSGFEGYGAMMLAAMVITFGPMIAALLGIVGIIRIERPLVLPLSAVALPAIIFMLIYTRVIEL